MIITWCCKMLHLFCGLCLVLNQNIDFCHLLCKSRKSCIFMHLAPIEAQPRLLPMGEHLPQSDPKHPGIRRMRESTRL